MKIAVISGKGGCGKSSVTAALIALWQQVVAIDCDVDASNLPLLFHPQPLQSEPFASGDALKVNASLCAGCGSCVSLCAYGALQMDASSGIVRSDDLLCEGCGLCARHCPTGAITLAQVAGSTVTTSRFECGMMVHGTLSPGDDNSGKMIARMRGIADELCRQQGGSVQILDGPPGIGCPVLSTVTGVDTVIIVTEPTRSGMSDLRRAARVAASYCSDLRVIINKCDLHAAHAGQLRQLCAENGWQILAELPFDRRMVEAQLQCQPIVDYAPHSPCSLALRRAFRLLHRTFAGDHGVEQ